MRMSRRTRMSAMMMMMMMMMRGIRRRICGSGARLAARSLANLSAQQTGAAGLLAGSLNGRCGASASSFQNDSPVFKLPRLVGYLSIRQQPFKIKPARRGTRRNTRRSSNAITRQRTMLIAS